MRYDLSNNIFNSKSAIIKLLCYLIVVHRAFLFQPITQGKQIGGDFSFFDMSFYENFNVSPITLHNILVKQPDGF